MDLSKTLKICRHVAVPVIVAVGVLGLSSAVGQTFTWNALDGMWSDFSKWIGGQAPTGIDASDQLQFNGSGYTATNDVAPAGGAAFVLNQFTFGTTGPVALAGNAVRLSGTAPAITQTGAGAVNLNLPISASTPVSFTGNGAGVVTINGALSGIFDLTKSGTSTYRFGSPGLGISSGNAWTGALNLAGGTVTFAQAAANVSPAAASALRGNAINFSSPSAQITSVDELRMGQISGTGGTVTVRDSNGNGRDVVLFASNNATFDGTFSNNAAGGTGAGKLAVRGVATQTLTGTVQINDDMTVGHGAGLVLAGNATLGTASAGAVVLEGGTFTLDNTATNNSDRLRDGAANDTSIETVSGGTFSLLGNASNSTNEFIGRLQLGNAKNPRGGALTINVSQPGNFGTTLSIASYSRVSTLTPRNTVDFTASKAGVTVAPGQSTSLPRILVFNITTTGAGGLLTSSDISDSAIGWATVNGSDFATSGSNGIAPVVTSLFGSSFLTSTNARIDSAIPNASITSASDSSLASLKINPGPGQTLSINGAGSLSTNGILLTGPNDFSIVNGGAGTGGISGPGGSRYFHVQSAVLTLGVSVAKTDLSGKQNSLTKSGAGTLVLTNPGNAALTKTLTINAGTVRATPGSSLTGGKIEFRGGVLEIVGGGTLVRTLGDTDGNLNWRGDDLSTGITPVPLANRGLSSADRGSGGFAAFGSDASVDLNGAGATNLTWEDPYFVDSNQALIFGSTRATNRVTFVDNIDLNGTGVAYSAREIRVEDNVSSTGDFARLSGSISGSTNRDLFKTGPGLLELSGNSSLNGATIIHEGEISVTGSTVSSFLTRVRSGAKLRGNGTVGGVLVESGGTLEPGDAANRAGILNTGDATRGGDVTFMDGTAKLVIELGGTTAGGDPAATYDRLNVTGSISLNGATLQGSLLNGFNPALGTLFFIMVNDGSEAVSGTFAQGGFVNFAGGALFEVSYTGNFVADGSGANSFAGGNDVVLRAVPEPSSIALLVGCGSLLALRRRRR